MTSIGSRRKTSANPSTSNERNSSAGINEDRLSNEHAYNNKLNKM